LTKNSRENPGHIVKNSAKLAGAPEGAGLPENGRRAK
jgi:hypothetical protein